MVDVGRIKAFDGENCKQIIYKVCQLAKTNIKIDNIEIAHRIKNGSIIMKFLDRPSRDELFTKKVNPKEIAELRLGWDGNSIFINELLALMSFD